MYHTIRHLFLATGFVASLSTSVFAQQPPSIGYMFPPGAQAGQTVEVTLGGYDWTPDMQLFVHDPRIKLEVIGPPGPVIVPEPPYWFGKKARRTAFPLPREIPAQLTIPAEVPAGIVRWQAANANGASASGSILVGDAAKGSASWTREGPENQRQRLTLPISVSGQIKKTQEIDRFEFLATQTGPITCAMVSRAIGSDLNLVLEVRDPSGQLIADAADTAGNDLALTFAATAGVVYAVDVYDLDFRGDRAFVYQLSMIPGPQVLAAIPASGRRGETRQVEFIGYGVATGAARLESTTRELAFPADPTATTFLYRLETPHGMAAPFTLRVSDLTETLESDDSTHRLNMSTAVTGILDERFAEDRYTVAGKKGDVWAIKLAAAKSGSPMDVALAVLDATGKELARSDDLPGSTDAALDFTVPADGEYQVGISESSGQSGNRAAVYHLTIEPAVPNFTLSIPEFLNAPLGGKTKLAVNVVRSAGFQDPIALTFTGLPSGVTAPDGLVITAKQKTLSIELTVAADAAASASLASLSGEAKVGDLTLHSSAGPMLIATTIKPPFVIDAEGKDDVVKWPRGTTFPSPVLIEREEGFTQEIVLEMTAKQSRHRQGITGPELIVAPDINRILYPIFLPEWLETTRTSRMIVNGVAKLPDPKGNIRYSVSRQKTRMGFLPTGALLKLSADQREIQIEPGQPLSIPLTIDRSTELDEPLRLELHSCDPQNSGFSATTLTLSADQNQVQFPILLGQQKDSHGDYTLTVRATVMKDGTLPVVSEATVLVHWAK